MTFDEPKIGNVAENKQLIRLVNFQLLDVVYREETLLNVMRSVTRNGRSILLTAVLALVLVYMFSIVGYMFFRDHFLVTVDKLDGELFLSDVDNLFLCTTRVVSLRLD